MIFDVLAGDSVVARLDQDEQQNRDRPLTSGRGETASVNAAPEHVSGPLRIKLRRVARALLEVFVPQGYPDSVGRGYAQFQLFDAVQGLCSYLRGVLSTRAVLSGLGVGHGVATAAAATAQWVYRDGAGMIGGLVFAWYGARRFSENVKGWRLCADLAVDVALTLELVSPLLCGGRQHCFTAVVCSANVLRAMCGVAAGATRAVITEYFARGGGNLADVQAKEGSQETAISLIGMVVGLWLTKFVDRNKSWERLPWVVFVCLTILHLVANYLAVSVLGFPDLNEARLSLLLSNYKSQNIGNGDLSVDRTNASENFILSFRNRYRFTVGVRPRNLEEIAGLDDPEKRCVGFYSPSGDRVNVVMRMDCDPEDVIKVIAQLVLGPENRFLPRVKAQRWRTDQIFLHDMGFRVRARAKSD